MLFIINSFFIFQDKEPEITEAQKKRLTIEETQKSLPIYPFKDDLIEAIENHQASFTFLFWVLYIFT